MCPSAPAPDTRGPRPQLSVDPQAPPATCGPRVRGVVVRGGRRCGLHGHVAVCQQLSRAFPLPPGRTAPGSRLVLSSLVERRAWAGLWGRRVSRERAALSRRCVSDFRSPIPTLPHRRAPPSPTHTTRHCEHARHWSSVTGSPAPVCRRSPPTFFSSQSPTTATVTPFPPPPAGGLPPSASMELDLDAITEGLASVRLNRGDRYSVDGGIRRLELEERWSWAQAQSYDSTR